MRLRLALTFPLFCLQAGTASGAVTFTKDVLPILERRCQGCHRPGEVAPMSFLTYNEARPWASAMREAVLTKKTPPWFADPHYGKFRNDRSLPKAEIDTLVKWPTPALLKATREPRLSQPRSSRAGASASRTLFTKQSHLKFQPPAPSNISKS